MSKSKSVPHISCLELANKVISLCKLDIPKITSFQDFTSQLFILLFEKTFGVTASGLILPPASFDDEIHNVQSIIDTMAEDILNLSLSHISGKDIMNKNMTAISDFLEVLEGYHLLCIPKLVAAETALLESCFELANKVIGLCNLAITKVTSLQNFTSQLFIDLFERTFGVTAPGLILPPASIDDEVQNIQTIINVMAEDILNLSLSHISAKDIIDKNINAICDFLEVVEGYHILSNPSATSSDGTETKEAEKASAKRKKKSLEREGTDGGSSVICKICGYQQVPGESSKESQFRFKFGDVRSCPMCSKKTGLFAESRSSSSEPDEEDLLTRPKTVATESFPFVSDVHLPAPSKSPERPNANHQLYLDLTPERYFYDPEFIHQKEQATQTSEKCVHRYESNKQSLKAHKGSSKQDDLVTLYSENLEKRLLVQLEAKTRHRHQAAQIKKRYLQSLREPYRIPVTPLCKKSFLLPYHLRVRPRYKHVPNHQVIQMRDGDELFFIEEMRKEFPGANLPPEDVQRMNQQYHRHLVTMHKCVRSALNEKSRDEILEEEAIRKQKILADIFQKERDQIRRSNELAEQKMREIRVRACHRDARLKSARVKQYYEDFKAERNKNLSKTKNQEDQLVRNLFKDKLQFEKEQVQHLRKLVKEKEQQRVTQEKIYLESLHNFYQNQYALLADSIAAKKHENEMRTKAQKQAAEQSDREYCSKLKSEIKAMQEQIYGSSDLHFRELDAERYREQLRDQYSSRT